ncbi:MAG: EamA family transporter [Verrucomicrobiota bacterium]
MPTYLLLPLAAAIVYSLGSILIKRALKEGVTMDQSFHLTNLLMGTLFLPLFFLEKQVIQWDQLFRPLAMGATFFAATWLTFVAIRRGDVSLVTPIMGTKVVFVAVGMVLFTGQALSLSLWLAAIMTPLGILVMSFSDFRKGNHLWFTIGVTLASAALFGVNDVMVNAWASSFGPLAFLSIGSITVSFISILIWSCQGRPALLARSAGRAHAGWGACCIGLQAILMGIALAFFTDATGINVVYSSRGLWAIVLVVVFGSFLGNSEHRDQGRAFIGRVVGTVILTVAVVIAVLDRANAAQ